MERRSLNAAASTSKRPSLLQAPQQARKKSVADIFHDTTHARYPEQPPATSLDLAHLTPEQLGILYKLRDSVAREDFPEKDGITGTFRLDDATLLRFLRTHNFNGYKATCAVKEHLQFRNKYKPHLITEREVRPFIESGFWTTQGVTKDEHPFELLIAKKFNPQRFQGDDLVRALIYQREQVAKMIRERSKTAAAAQNELVVEDNDFVLRERTLLLIDASEFNVMTQGSVLGMRQIRMITELLQAHWPETLGVAAIVNASVTFRWVFSIIRRMLDEETASRVTFVSNLEELHELIDPAVLSKKYGGTLDDGRENVTNASSMRKSISLRKTLVNMKRAPTATTAVAIPE